jgi:hypothetical protein
MMGLGWKMILGGVLLALGQIMGAAITDCPVEAWIPWFKWLAGLFNAAGMVFGAVGVSSKVATATNYITRSLDLSRSVISNAVTAQSQGRSEVIERVIEKRIPYIAKIINEGDMVKIKRSDGKIETVANVSNQVKPDNN